MHSAMKTSLISIALVSASAFSGASFAANEGYLVDSGSNAVKAATAGVCVRTGSWSPAQANALCDPDLAPKPAPAPAPAPMPKQAPAVTPPPAPAPAPAPEPKAAPAPAPAAAPKAAPAPAKPAAAPKKPEPLNITEKIELQNIAFDKDQLSDDNKKELKEFLDDLRKANKERAVVDFGAVVVTGHTDRLGSIPYNMKLSERRAVVAKDYLVGTEKVDSKLIFWEGKGPKQPIPVTKFCDNKMNRKQLIECLGPNRRVTIEVVGTAMPAPKPAPKPAAK